MGSTPGGRAGAEGSAEDLYEHAPCGFVSSLPDGSIVRVNATFLRWLGYDRDELTGARRLHELLAPGDRIYYETHYAPLLHMQGEVRAIAVELLRADGSRMPALLNSVLVAAVDGRPAVVRTAVFDATDRRRYEQELLRAREEAKRSEERARALARTLQASLIPPELPRVPGLDLGAVYHPALEGVDIGGDFYDVFENAAGEWAVLVGDVAGKGPEAATVTALTRYTARGAAMRSSRPSDVLDAINQALLHDRSERHCTVVYARVHAPQPDGTRLTLCSGGHPPALHVAADGRITPVASRGTLLGAFDEVALRDEVVELATGDAVVLFTDGVTEARRGDSFYGDGRLHALVAGARDGSASEIANAVADEVVAFQEGRLRDDVAVVVLKAAT